MRKSLYVFGLVVAMGAVAGCASQAQQDAANEASCIKWGAAAGTPLFVDCMTALRGADAAVADAQAQRVMAAGAALQGAGKASQGPTSLHCTSVSTGQITNTSCQ